MNTHDVSYAIAFVPFCSAWADKCWIIKYGLPNFYPAIDVTIVTFEPDFQQPLAYAQFTWCNFLTPWKSVKDW